jgi:chromosome segregation ATPase
MRIGIPVFLALAGLLVGFAVGFVYQQPAVESAEERADERVQEVGDLLRELEIAESRIAEQQTEIEQLRGDVDQLTDELQDLNLEFQEVRNDLDDRELLVTAERERADELERELQGLTARSEELEELAEALWQDRRLLEELNRAFPGEPDEFTDHVERLADLAVRIHPELEEEAETVVAAVPGYLAWQEELTEQEISLLLLINAGAREFNAAYREFQEAAIRAVIERLSTVVDQI